MKDWTTSFVSIRWISLLFSTFELSMLLITICDWFLHIVISFECYLILYSCIFLNIGSTWTLIMNILIQPSHFFFAKIMCTDITGVAIFIMGTNEKNYATSQVSPSSKNRRHNTTRYIGCEFYIMIVRPTNTNRDAHVFLLTSFTSNILLTYM